jgi:hypothetical protein
LTTLLGGRPITGAIRDGGGFVRGGFDQEFSVPSPA